LLEAGGRFFTAKAQRRHRRHPRFEAAGRSPRAKGAIKSRRHVLCSADIVIRLS